MIWYSYCKSFVDKPYNRTYDAQTYLIVYSNHKISIYD